MIVVGTIAAMIATTIILRSGVPRTASFMAAPLRPGESKLLVVFQERDCETNIEGVLFAAVDRDGLPSHSIQGLFWGSAEEHAAVRNRLGDLNLIAKSTILSASDRRALRALGMRRTPFLMLIGPDGEMRLAIEFRQDGTYLKEVLQALAPTGPMDQPTQ